jgi:hypothetical protein
MTPSESLDAIAFVNVMLKLYQLAVSTLHWHLSSDTCSYYISFKHFSNGLHDHTQSSWTLQHFSTCQCMPVAVECCIFKSEACTCVVCTDRVMITMGQSLDTVMDKGMTPISFCRMCDRYDTAAHA